MSDWYRSGRDDDRRRYGAEGRVRREMNEQDRGPAQGQRAGEQRSFDERQPDRDPGGYGGEPPRYGQGGGGLGLNPTLERIAGGYADHVWRSDTGAGEHRGRGPKNYTRSDVRIREDVSDRLSDDSWLDASEIEVQVSSCEVTLMGTVQTREDKRRAEDLTEQVSGVKHVQNNLRIEPHPTQNPRTTPANAGGSGPPVT